MAGFNSLQTGKRNQSKGTGCTRRNQFSFNSLQTGKRNQRATNDTHHHVAIDSFNSLQTGKRNQSRTKKPDDEKEEVSIPFKRESVIKAGYACTHACNPVFVSIPFKRESVIKAKKQSISWTKWMSFNSLQTGKRNQRKFYADCTDWLQFVSIPFKRESVIKVPFS